MIEIEGLHLTHDENENVVVEIQVSGLWYPVIKEGHENFDHFVTARGMVEEIHRINLDLVRNTDQRLQSTIDSWRDEINN